MTPVGKELDKVDNSCDNYENGMSWLLSSVRKSLQQRTSSDEIFRWFWFGSWFNAMVMLRRSVNLTTLFWGKLGLSS